MEATSIAGLEAMASGVPLVASRVGGLPLIVEDGVTGLLVPPRSPEDLASALLRLLRDTGLRTAMATAARERAVREFDWRVIARRTESFYLRVLESREPALGEGRGADDGTAHRR